MGKKKTKKEGIIANSEDKLQQKGFREMTWSERFDAFLTSRRFFGPVAGVLIFLELLLNAVIIFKVPYTEIDWIAYMQEVEGVLLKHDLDYSHLKGDTGPLVYPAGFVYIFSVFWYLTDKGTNIFAAQGMFGILHVMFLAIVFTILYQTRAFPTWALPIVCFSFRIHSIFVLRLFNDCIAMYILYISIYLFLERRWFLGCTYFSVAVSVKMNVLLYAPALGLLMVKEMGWKKTLPRVLNCVLIQVVLGLPFLAYAPRSYLAGAFELNRVFFYKWTVNFRFLPENVFLSPWLSIGLLTVHMALLAYFAVRIWNRYEGGLWNVVTGKFYQKDNYGYRRELSAEHIVTVLFSCNFIGMACSRSIHYQFYVWYYHTIPYLIWQTKFSPKVKATWMIIIPAATEFAFNTYPSTNLSSAVLQAAHWILVLQLMFSTFTKPYGKRAMSFIKNKKKIE